MCDDRNTKAVDTWWRRRPGTRGTGVEEAPRAMNDVLYAGLVIGFFALSWAFIKLCDRL